jgi:hypothetical protein
MSKKRGIDNNKERFRRLLNVFGVLFIFDLIYLDVCAPLALSIEQIYEITVTVTIICESKGLDVSSLSLDQLNEILELAVKAVKEIFTKNGFRFTHRALAAEGGVDILPDKKALAIAVPGVLSRSKNFKLLNIVEDRTLYRLSLNNLKMLGEIVREYFTTTPLHLQLYLLTKAFFIAMNITCVDLKVLRYGIWLVSTSIQVAYLQG